MTASPVVLRPALASDAPALAELAALDSSRALTGEIVLAASGGGIAAAMSLETGAVIADPFVATGGLVDMLRVAARPAAPRPRRRLLTAPLLARAAV
jgi:hypothetical protein